jgi:hypothetical protein
MFNPREVILSSYLVNAETSRSAYIKFDVAVQWNLV